MSVAPTLLFVDSTLAGDTYHSSNNPLSHVPPIHHYHTTIQTPPDAVAIPELSVASGPAMQYCRHFADILSDTRNDLGVPTDINPGLGMGLENTLADTIAWEGTEPLESHLPLHQS